MGGASSTFSKDAFVEALSVLGILVKGWEFFSTFFFIFLEKDSPDAMSELRSVLDQLQYVSDIHEVVSVQEVALQAFFGLFFFSFFFFSFFVFVFVFDCSFPVDCLTPKQFAQHFKSTTAGRGILHCRKIEKLHAQRPVGALKKCGVVFCGHVGSAIKGKLKQ
jgi:hypothetical protein